MRYTNKEGGRTLKHFIAGLCLIASTLACSSAPLTQTVTPLPPTVTAVTQTNTPLPPTVTPLPQEGNELVVNGNFSHNTLRGWHIRKDMGSLTVKDHALEVGANGGVGLAGVSQWVWFPQVGHRLLCQASAVFTDRASSELLTTGLVLALTDKQQFVVGETQNVTQQWLPGFVTSQFVIGATQKNAWLFVGVNKTAEEEFFVYDVFDISLKCAKF